MPPKSRSISRRDLLATLAVAALAACKREPQRAASRTRVVAVATLLTHPALDQVVEGTRAELRRQGFIEGRDLRIVLRNANGQASLAPTIAEELAAQRPDVVVAVTTPIAQAVARAVRGPVVFSAVTDPVSAGLVQDLARPDPRITGVSDAWPYEAQLRLIREILPQARTLGLMYNPGEAAGQFGARRIRELAPRFGFTLVEGAVASTNDVAAVAESLAPRVDVLFPSSDNTVLSGIAGAVRVAIDRRRPLFAGDSGTVEHGAIAAASVGYVGVGRETGALVARLLRGERNLPVIVASEAEVYINARAAEQMGVTVPAAVLQRARRVVHTIQ